MSDRTVIDVRKSGVAGGMYLVVYADGRFRYTATPPPQTWSKGRVMALRTTRGHAHLRHGYIVIEFGVMDPTFGLTDIELDVDAYALELARDLLDALSEQAQREDA